MNRLSTNIKSVNYPGNPEPVLKDIAFELDSGQVILLTGNTGSGKTTILHCINGLIPKSISAEMQGGLLWNGEKLSVGSRTTSTTASILTVLQNPFHSFLEYLNGFKGEARTSTWISRRMAQTNSFMDLSAGERQRLILMKAFEKNPDILLLDEPINRLDVPGQEAFFNALAQRKKHSGGVTIIAEHHYHSFPDLVDVRLELTTEEQSQAPYSLIELCEGLKALTAKPGNGYMAKLEAISLKIKEKPILNKLNLDIFRGEILGIYGENGCGKTTLGRILMKRLKPNGGTLRYAPNLKTAIVTDNPYEQFLCNTVGEEISFGADNYDLPPSIPESLLFAFKLGEYRHQSNLKLSFGQQCLTVMAATLSVNPDLVIFDEPTQGLDYFKRNNLIRLMKGLQEIGKSFLVLSHDEDFLQAVSDKIFLLSNGRLEEISRAPESCIIAFENENNLHLV
jgi:energy-coupling factor transport system ATP-binding protein